MTALSIPTQVHDLVQRGALFVVNHSGGKDSQAMYLALAKLVPTSQIVVVHADLGAVEWAGALSHIRDTVHAGVPIRVCKARRTLLEMIEERGMFPSPSNRQCTSDLKRGPIERTIRELVERRRDLKQIGADIVVNCMGMRAQESSGRAKLEAFKFSNRNSKNGREWYDWLPIHDWTEEQVFASIKAEGQQPHPVYAKGMTRFSCCFCIMASQADLTTAARLATTEPELLNDPDLYRKYVALERSTGQVMLMPSKKRGRQTLEQVTGIKAQEEVAS